MFLGFSLRLFVLTIAAICSSAESQVPHDHRIINGVATNIRETPYLVGIWVFDIFNCGGTLISDRLVVTAAHCVYDSKPKELSVAGGSTLLSEVKTKSKVDTFRFPSEFDPKTYYMDVAVLKLTDRLKGANISPIALCSISPKTGDSVKVSGWGKTNEKNLDESNQLFSINVPIISEEKCRAGYRHRLHADVMICAADPGVSDACQGDSGGPMVFKNQLCGIVSWGIGCAKERYPGIYTNVAAVRNYIDKSIAELS